MRRIVLLSTVAGLMIVLSSAPVALAEIRVGTDGNDDLVGTNSNDHITGKGGSDTLQGKARNDTYHFDDNFGQDTLTETATVKVGKKKLPGGIDTLNFSQVSDGPMAITLVPQWTAQDQGFNAVSGPSGTSVTLGSSPVENVVGGLGGDILESGSARNTYKGGPGGGDLLIDYGGVPAISTFPALAPSDDTYKGFTSGTGMDQVIDHGGTADKLDLRPLESSDVYFDRFDSDTIASGEESLRIVINDSTQVEVFGHFSPTGGQQNGRMEQIIFSNEIVTSAASMM